MNNKQISCDLLDELQLAMSHVNSLWEILDEHESGIRKDARTLLHFIRQQTDLINTALDGAKLIKQSVATKKEVA
ncbi:hypothetical protein ACM5Q9_09705 [Advenella sp. RU8]|uniref:hypothetical protein n=1 Tax=Advenella sp. RU8 TaxID=3399575 RepID=UPI003AAAC5CE